MAYLFNGATHRINRADAVVQTWPLTMFGRIRLTAGNDGLDHTIVYLAESGADNGFRLRVESSGGVMRARVATKAGGAASSATTTTSISDTNWHTVVGEVTSDALRQVWLDNGGNGAQSQSRTPGTLAKTTIGAADNGGAFSANVAHEIADVAIWSGTLTADQRAALNAGMAPPLVRLEGLEFYWPGTGGTQELLGGAMTVTGATVTSHPRVYMPPSRLFVGIPPSSVTQHNETISEGIGVSPTLAVNTIFSGVISDGVGTGEAPTGNALLSTIASESVATAETLIESRILDGQLADTAQVADLATTQQVFQDIVSDALSIADLATTQQVFQDIVSDALSIADAINTGAILEETVAENLALAEVLTPTAIFGVVITDNANVVDDAVAEDGAIELPAVLRRVTVDAQTRQVAVAAQTRQVAVGDQDRRVIVSALDRVTVV